MYNLFTQWITLSVIFFLANYACNFIEVVTLGGLVAGSFLIGACTPKSTAAQTPAFPVKLGSLCAKRSTKTVQAPIIKEPATKPPRVTTSMKLQA